VSSKLSRRSNPSKAPRQLPNRADGDPDPISAGTAGEAALWGGSSAAVGMAANPFGAHQADPIRSAARPVVLMQPGAFAEDHVIFKAASYRNSEKSHAMILPAKSETTHPSAVMIIVPRAKAPAIFHRVTA
jgi:hypothetical protein